MALVDSRRLRWKYCRPAVGFEHPPLARRRQHDFLP
jgi:hypothetical protein